MVNHRRQQPINQVILVQSDLISRKFDFCQTPAIITRETFNGEAEVGGCAPGRVNLIGELDC